jgi:hypothetical protein
MLLLMRGVGFVVGILVFSMWVWLWQLLRQLVRLLDGRYVGLWVIDSVLVLLNLLWAGVSVDFVALKKGYYARRG